MIKESIFTIFLRELDVRHTTEYSTRRFRNMPFKSLFGFSRLLQSYGIPNASFSLDNKEDIVLADTPFIAQKGHTFVVVTDICNSASDGELLTWRDEKDVQHTGKLSDFLTGFSGVILQAYPDENSIEPDYSKHHLCHIASRAKRVLLLLCAVAIFIAGFIASGLWRHVSTSILMAINLGGIFITWLLILKSLKVRSATADKVCGALQKHGCDHVLEDKASSFFGLFGWSEVGFAYFTVTTAILLLFPEAIRSLTLINGCCLPFTLWSIWYQKFRIKTWCTLCVITQCLLWAQFFCYLLGGWWKTVLPLHPEILLIGAAYLGVMLSINAVCTFIKNRIN